MFVLALSTLAFAYTVDDVCFAAQRAMPDATVEGIARGVQTIGSEDAVKLLRCGVTPALLSTVTEGAHPTPEEMSAALTAGFLPSVVGPKVYTGLSDRDWLRILGADLVFKAPEGGEVNGRLKSVQLDELTVTTAAGDVVLKRDAVISVRRQDGFAIHVDSKEEGAGYREEPTSVREPLPDADHGQRLRASGQGLVAGGVVATLLGALAAGVATNKITDPDTYNAGSATGRVGSWVALADLGYACLVSGPPMVIGGVVMITIGNHQRDR